MEVIIVDPWVRIKTKLDNATDNACPKMMHWKYLRIFLKIMVSEGKKLCDNSIASLYWISKFMISKVYGSNYLC